MDVLQFMREFYQNASLVGGINSSFITLIPKVQSPSCLNEYRPISLIGSLYKLLAKVLANRMKQVMPKIISEVQSAFFGGRNILDGVLIANEIVDGWRKSNRKGLGLNILLSRAKELDIIKGADVGSNGLRVTHLQFADDTILFCEANRREVSNIKSILRCFEIASGLKINYHKSIICGIGVDDGLVLEFAASLNCLYQKLPIQYLGFHWGLIQVGEALGNPFLISLNRNWPPGREGFYRLLGI
ncbi:uncharacterized protein LOC114273078 [Camellia sinensis]|uniref:uncharacterized protein LOC114273078 n=1 Tax=Camellia sinensis TaxID=4442 RepID=UPI001036A62B|nr:uncharacterized protein LOC114273078 [Camellia sinensis]